MNARAFPLLLVASIVIGPASTIFAQSVPAPVLTASQPAPFRLQAVPGWGAVPEGMMLGPTHGGVAVDKAGNVYFSTDSSAGIFVFGADGRFIRSMGAEFAGTLALAIAEQDGVEYLYGAHFRGARVLKARLNGGRPATLPFPKEAGIYGPQGEGYKPSAVAVAPDGSIFVADGFGTDYIHKYDAAGTYLGSFGGKGAEEGKLMHCQGLAIDARFGEPLLLACDTDNRRLQYFSLGGEFVQIAANDLRRPVAAACFGTCVAVAELDGRVTILDQNNAVAMRLGDNPNQTHWSNFRLAAADFQDGIFAAPHGLGWDRAGNLYLQEWNLTGRVVKMRRLP